MIRPKGRPPMNSKIREALGLKLEPVAIVWSDEKPPGAIEFSKGKWGCVMWLVASAARGKAAAVTEETFGCWGGGVGLGFGNQYQNFPGGLECFYRFLSTGNQSWERGRAVASRIPPESSKEFLEDFLKGERYKKTPELVQAFVRDLPITRVPTRYVILKPLGDLEAQSERPVVVTFIAQPHELSALVILANYRREGLENVIIPYAAGCQTIGVIPYREAASSSPRAVVGLTDISARLYLRGKIPGDCFSLSVPWKMFLEMEEDLQGSFLEGRTWGKLRKEGACSRKVAASAINRTTTLQGADGR